MPNTAWLSLVATTELGGPVPVETLPPAASERGRAGWDGARHVVRLAQDLDGRELLQILYHELGHLACGHVAKGAPTKAGTPPPHPDSIMARLVGPVLEARQREAEAWAASLAQNVRNARPEWHPAGRAG